MKNEHGCNRCQYTWEGNDGICPICGNPATHYLVSPVNPEKEEKMDQMYFSSDVDFDWGHPIALLNTSIATADGTYKLKTITLDQAKGLIANRETISAIGHNSTAQILTELLGIEVPVNRIQFEQQEEQTALVFKLQGRPPEGKILSREEIESIGYKFQILRRIK
jgi:hypothetical protein